MAFLAPIVAKVGVFLAGKTIGAFLAKTAISVAVRYGLSKISKALAPKPQAGEPLSGVEIHVQIGGDIAYQAPVGRVLVRGQLIYHNTNGASNQFHQQVFVLADWPCDSLQQVFIDGRVHAITQIATGTGFKTYTVNGFADQITLRFWDGTQTAADPNLISNANPAGKWTTNSVVSGKCYVAVFWTYKKPTEITTDYDLFEAGIPDIGFEIKGAKLYDPRKDTTNGGSGAHRWDTPSTWEYSENPVIALYNFQRGFFQNGEKVLGMGVPAYDLAHSTYFAAANVCDEVVAIGGEGGAGTELRYRCAIILSADASVPYASTLDALLSTFAGYLYDYAGVYVCQAGAAQSSVKTITDADLVIGQGVTFAAKRSRADLVNSIHGQFLDPLADYEPNSYGAQVSAGGIVNDGEELGHSLDLLAVPSRTQAERIAKIRLLEMRAQASAAITLGFNHIDLQVGDWKTWNSARFGNKTWRIVEREVDAQTRTVSFELAEINAAVFSWATADEGVQPAVPVPIATGSRLSAPNSFNVQPATFTGPDGRVMPALAFSWTAITDPTVDQVIIEYRQVDVPASVLRVADDSPGDGSFITANGVVGGVNYEARASLRTTPPRQIVWTPWSDDTTTDNEALIATLSAQLLSELALITNNVQGSLQALQAELDEIIEQTAHDAAVDTAVSYDRRKEIVSRVAAVRRTAEIELSAAVLQVNEAIVTEQEARATALTAVTAIANSALGLGQQATDLGQQATASGLIKLEAVATPAGSLARFQVYLRVDSGSSYVDAGFYIDVSSGGIGRVVIDADQFAVLNGSSPIVPFLVSGGNVYMPSVIVQSLDADTVSATQIVLNGVGFNEIAVGAVSAIEAADGTSVNITRRSGKALITVSFNTTKFNTMSDSAAVRTLTITRNGAAIRSYAFMPALVDFDDNWGDDGKSYGGFSTFHFVDTAAVTGLCTYAFSTSSAHNTAHINVVEMAK